MEIAEIDGDTAEVHIQNAGTQMETADVDR